MLSNAYFLAKIQRARQKFANFARSNNFPNFYAQKHSLTQSSAKLRPEPALLALGALVVLDDTPHSFSDRDGRFLECLCFSNFYSNVWYFFQKILQTLRGSLSAVSKPNFASKYAFESSRRDLQDLHAFAPLSIQNFSQISSNFFAFSQFYFQNITDF